MYCSNNENLKLKQKTFTLSLSNHDKENCFFFFFLFCDISKAIKKTYIFKFGARFSSFFTDLNNFKKKEKIIGPRENIIFFSVQILTLRPNFLKAAPTHGQSSNTLFFADEPGSETGVSVIEIKNDWSEVCLSHSNVPNGMK